MNEAAQIEMEIHPLAEAYRMHTMDEMDELVASISRNGLRDPITLDQKGRIIDGRNREKACQIAGVEPRFETFEGDEEAIAEFIHDRNCRRDLTTGQKALAYAILFPEGRQGERTDIKRKNGDVDFPTNGEVSSQRISDARAILKYAPGDVEAIKLGDEPFTKIVEKAKAIKRQQEPAESRVSKLGDERLASLVRSGDLSIEAAEAEVQVRKQRLAERRDKAIDFLRRCVTLFADLAVGDFEAFMVENLSDPLFRARLVQALELDRVGLEQTLQSVSPATATFTSVLHEVGRKL